MQRIVVVCLLVLVALSALTSCGKSKQQLAEEAKQREATVKMEAERKKAEEARIQAQAEERERKEKINKYREQLLGNLKDPSSAQLRNLRMVTGEGGEALCGEINGKNSYGGYIGFHPFAVTEQQMKNTNGNVIIFNPNEDWLIAKANQIRIGEAGCVSP